MAANPSQYVGAIAIIGMAGRFPGAANLDQFWHNLSAGVESISFFSDEELVSAGVDPATVRDPQYVKARAVLDEIDLFDASFFGYSPREAEVLDPQQRLFLECAWGALDQAGYTSETFDGLVGVYGGAGADTYQLFNLYSNRSLAESVGYFQLLLANSKDFLATRVSYKLNLRGPSVTVQSACSTSLVAVHLACQSVLNGECDLALAGGVSITVPQTAGYLYQDGGIRSPDGHCRAFDAAAKGTVGGSGVGVVVLKRLDQALEDGDTIHAIIRGSAINNDGASKVGYTAPSVEGQATVITEALAMAGVEPETVTYIETHGTGTPLGDPIEIAALTRAFQAGTSRREFCAIGSVKTNVGHLDAAAGVAGLIKAVLALKHKALPPSLHFEQPNPQIDFATSPFYVNATLMPWQQSSSPRRAGVSAFGLGGTNAHVVLEEAPPAPMPGAARPWQVLVLSAKTSTALEAATDQLAAYLAQPEPMALADVASTLQRGRRTFAQRRVLICRAHPEAADALRTRDPQRVLTGSVSEPRSVAFVCAGLGDQYPNMTRGLYEHEPVFRAHVDACAEYLLPIMGQDIRHVLYPHQDESPAPTPPPADRLRSLVAAARRSSDASTGALTATEVAQPVLFVIEYALAQLWISWGLRPRAVIGYSLGEYVAACLAGVLSREDALTLVARRAQMIAALPGGAMLAVPLSEAETQPLLGPEISLAAVNGPVRLCVLAGPELAIAALEERLRVTGLITRRVPTTHAFHSMMLAPIAAPLTELVRQMTLRPPQIPCISNVTGTWMTAAEATNPAYWAKHLCAPVRFGDGIQTLLGREPYVLLELGAGQTLSALIAQHLRELDAPESVILPTVRNAYEPRPDQQVALEALGQAWLAGALVDWAGFSATEQRQRVPLPTYPFERQRYWVVPGASEAAPAPTLSPGKRADVADWLYAPLWKQSLPLRSRLSAPPVPAPRALILSDGLGLGAALEARLREAGLDVISVQPGSSFARRAPGRYTINPAARADYHELLADLQQQDRLPQSIFHLWSVTAEVSNTDDLTRFEDAQALGLYSLLFLAQSLGRHVVDGPVQLLVVSQGVQKIEHEDRIRPEQATMLGPCRVIPQEYPHIRCRHIDIEVSGDGSVAALSAHLLAELSAPPHEVTLAYRGTRRWTQTFDPLGDMSGDMDSRLREHGVYLITGGLGQIGLTLAHDLAENLRARLVLTSRSGLPEREAWPGWLATHDPADQTSARIRAVQGLEQAGAEVLVLRADVADLAQMQSVIQTIDATFGALHGIIHAAGVIDPSAFATIAETDMGRCALHFRAKVHGLYVLDQVLAGRQLDLRLALSSLSTVLGGLGFTAYVAANSFLDAWAQQHDGAAGPAWISVDWDGAATPEETRTAFAHLWALRSLPQIVVSTADLALALASWVKREQAAAQPAAQPETSRHARPALANPYVPAQSEAEQIVAGVIQELLGIEPVGVHDNFFQLGGDSLLGTQVVARLRAAFQVDLPLRQLFETPTVAGMALVIEAVLIEEILGADEATLADHSVANGHLA